MVSKVILFSKVTIGNVSCANLDIFSNTKWSSWCLVVWVTLISIGGISFRYRVGLIISLWSPLGAYLPLVFNILLYKADSPLYPRVIDTCVILSWLQIISSSVNIPNIPLHSAQYNPWLCLSSIITAVVHRLTVSNSITQAALLHCVSGLHKPSPA